MNCFFFYEQCTAEINTYCDSRPLHAANPISVRVGRISAIKSVDDQWLHVSRERVRLIGPVIHQRGDAVADFIAEALIGVGHGQCTQRIASLLKIDELT